MRCETCQGTGKVLGYSPTYGILSSSFPCPDCNGCAIAHCCEGHQAQPEVEPADGGAGATKKRQSTSAAQR